MNAMDSPYSQGASGSSHSFGSLPSRQKNTGSANTNSRHGSLGQYQPAPNSSSGGPSPQAQADVTATWTNFDMDLSTDISASDNQPSASDNASPATMNSSSNNEFTPPNADRLFPNVRSQKQANTVNTGPGAPAGPMATDVTSFSGDQSFTQFLDPAQDPTDMENPFTMGASWVLQSAPAGGDSDDVMATAEPLSNAQLEQMLQGVPWTVWDH